MDQCVKQVICYTLYLFLIMCFSLLMTKGKGNNHKQDKASKIAKTEERNVNNKRKNLSLITNTPRPTRQVLYIKTTYNLLMMQIQPVDSKLSKDI